MAEVLLRWLYALFVGINANFCLKCLITSSEKKDPGLNHGYAYFVKDTNFKKYLQEFLLHISNDISTCNNHDAIKSASARGEKGIAASGVGKVECACHNMKHPLFIGDLQKEEQYVLH